MMKRQIKRTTPSYWLAVGFGCGLFPFFPGTVASLVAIIFWLPISHFSALFYWSFILLTAILGVWICHKTARVLNLSDPGCIVWDEFVGMWITLFFIAEKITWISVLTAFLLFRFLDIIKPWPIRWFERHMIGGWGIMADDIIAGLLAGFCIFLINFFS